MTNAKKQKIIIVGGGFGGVSAALTLSKMRHADAEVLLISDQPHFEYQSALYRVVAGAPSQAVAIPLADVFAGKNIKMRTDAVVKVNLINKKLETVSGAVYSFDFLIMALGVETIYFNIPGLEKSSFGFKSLNEALKLRQHLEKTLASCQEISLLEKKCAARVVVIGGGASGVELAGELSSYLKKLAKKYNLDPSLIQLDLIEAMPRLLPTLPEDTAQKTANRLQKLKVRIILNKAVSKAEIKRLHLQDEKINTQTAVWTAGVKPHRLYSQIKGLKLDQKGRVKVDEFLQAKGQQNIFVIGDGASTPYTGMAQTAIRDGCYAAQVISNKLSGRSSKPYRPKTPFYAIPIGPRWAAVIMGRFKFYGLIGWWLRRLADLHFFLSILPLSKAISVFRCNGKLKR